MDHATINKDDAFRNAFNAIARRALPFMAADAYHSDLLYDAARASALAPEARFYLLVRKLGTNIFAYGDDAVKHCDPRLSDGEAVLRVVRGKFDTYRVDVIHVREPRA
jgi:hypothetical protein